MQEITLRVIHQWQKIKNIHLKTGNYSAASYCCKAPWLFASDIAIVSDQSFVRHSSHKSKANNLEQYNFIELECRSANKKRQTV
ncbi:hypothetical protein [Desulfobotulus alkaliphilus]|uniref:hypothetical protein n=1 Tax=Desulfobotulus alkaliphilus TaxID=622671 RepID=UPI001C95A5A7|nr:hypothetical protein [Desulfobotulus alkaliphilus]